MIYLKLIVCLLLLFTFSSASNDESAHTKHDLNHKLVKRQSNDTKLKKQLATKKPTQVYKTDVVKPIVGGSKATQTSSTTEKISANGTNETNGATVMSTSGKLPNANSTVSTYDSASNATEVSYDPEEPLKIPPNVNKTEDHHTYYNSTMYSDPAEAMKFWVDLSSIPEHVITHEMLSNSHRRAATVKLNFTFPFYGHAIDNVTIATGGFMYLGETVHSWLAATQYIAPLMANFDTSISNTSNIQYADTGNNFTVQWDHVMLKDQKEKGTFSFQVTIKKNGDIIFVYKDVPFSVINITDDQHPVKIGISDAYVVDRTTFFLRRKTIFEYHRIDFLKGNIDNNTAIYFTALPTCLSLKDCHSCMTHKIGFDCKWCPAAGRCSNGFDRYRQEWISRGCDERHSNATCDAIDTSLNEVNTQKKSQKVAVIGEHKTDYQSVHPLSYRTESTKSGESSASKAGLLSVVILITLVASVALWIFYAYRNPQTSSGQFLIKYRPAEWRWSGSEARYTAASIHM